MARDARWERGSTTANLLRLLGDGSEADAAARAPLLAAVAHVLDAPPHDVAAILSALRDAVPDVESAAVVAPGDDGWSTLASVGLAQPPVLPRDVLEHGSIAGALHDPSGVTVPVDALPPGLVPPGARAVLALAAADRSGAPVCLVLLGWRAQPRHAGSTVARVAAERIGRAVEVERLAHRAAHAERAAGRTGGFRDQVLAIVGHDLRNPLGAIVMSAALLRTRGGLEGWQARTVDRVRSSAMRMGRIIDDLLSYTRTRLGDGIPVRRAATDLGEVARRVVDELRGAHPGAAIELHTAGDLTGQWDAARLEQVLSNLVSNAIDHGEEDAPVTVTVEPAGDAVSLTVANLGEMPPATVEHAFEAFHRGPEETGRKASGLGLGLFIAREIVRGHGGEIQLRSGEGRTRVVASLPRA